MLTRWFSVLGLVGIAAVIASALIMGKPTRNGSPETTRLVLAVTGTVGTRDVYQRVVDRFTAENPDVSVEILPVTGRYYQKLLIMFAGGKGPDLMWMGQGFTDFAARNVFLDISDRIKEELDLSAYHPAPLEWYRFEGRQYGVPFGIDLKFMAYNKRLFDQAGLPYPTNDWNIDQFLTAVRTLTIDRDGDGRPDQYGFSGDLDYSLFDANVIDDQGTMALCNTPAMHQYLEMNLALRNKERVALRAGKTLDETLTLFRQGKVAIIQLTTADLAFLRQRVVDVEWDLVANPTLVRKAHWASSQAIVISASTKHPDKAWALSKMFLEDEFQREMSRFVLPSNRQVAQAIVDENTTKPENLEALLVAAESMVPMPRVRNVSEMVHVFNEACESAFAGLLTPGEAMARAEQQINEIIANVKLALE